MHDVHRMSRRGLPVLAQMSAFRQRTGRAAAPQDASITISIPDSQFKVDGHHVTNRRRERKTRLCSMSALGLIVLVITAMVATTSIRSSLRQRALRRRLTTLSRRTVVSIGTVPRRRDQLLKTLDSIFRQTYPPSRVQIHYSSSRYKRDYSIGRTERTKGDDESYPDLGGVMREARQLLEDAQTSQRAERIRTEVSFHAADPNWRSATKLLGFLRQEWGATSPPVPSNNAEGGHEEELLVVVADDDFQYLPTWLESLLAGHLLFPESAIALRGWRIRKDLRYGAPSVGDLPHPDGVWGSFPAVERYVIRGTNIVEPYRVGVATGVNGILLRPSFFGSEIFDAPLPDHLSVDDIWYSGNLASKSIERWIVPFIGSGNRDRDVGNHLGQAQTVIDSKLKASNRARANQMAIEYFAEAWERGDGESLWWTKGSVPKLRGLLPFRHWFSEHIILWLYSFRWIRNLVGDWGV